MIAIAVVNSSLGQIPDAISIRIDVSKVRVTLQYGSDGRYCSADYWFSEEGSERRCCSEHDEITAVVDVVAVRIVNDSLTS